MSKGLLISIVLHGILLLFVVIGNFISFDNTAKTKTSVVDVALSVPSKSIAKKTQVAKKKVIRRKIVKKKTVKKSKPVIVKKKTKKVKKKKIKKKQIKKKIIKKKPVEKKSVLKKVNKVKKSKVSNNVKKKKVVVSNKDVKTTTAEKKGKNKNVVSDIKKKSATQSVTKKDNSITRTEFLAFRQQIQSCWKVPAGVKDSHNLITKILIAAAPDGTVKKAEIYKTSKPLTNRAMKVMAESALRAILSQQCSPLDLPREKYKQWREIIVTFDPKLMVE